MADNNKDINNSDLLNIYDENHDTNELFETKDESKTVIDTPTEEIGKALTVDEKTVENKIEDFPKESDIESQEIDDDIDSGFMDEINELKEEGEKKSFFGNLFKKKEKEIEEEGEKKLDDINNENVDTEVGFEDELNELKEEGEKKSFFGNLFKKKEKENIEIDDSNTDGLENNSELKDESTNIFDDFNQDEGLLDEVDKIKKDRDRDIFYYFEKSSKILQTLFIFSIIGLIIINSYIYVQNKVYVENKDSQLLGPICFVLLGDIKYTGNFCTSISTLNSDYTKKLQNTKEEQLLSILGILQRLYKIENFTKTKDVLFLKEKTETKLKVLDILSEFDNIKNDFDKIDKQKIQCKSFNINQNKNLLTVSCKAYSAGYETGIRGFDGKNNNDSLLKGTSISIANSFLNYINLESDKFTIIDRQKLFKTENIIGLKTGFTNSTSFNLKLKYNMD